MKTPGMGSATNPPRPDRINQIASRSVPALRVVRIFIASPETVSDVCRAPVERAPVLEDVFGDQFVAGLSARPEHLQADLGPR